MDPITIDLPEELLGERVLIRPYRAGDGVALFEAVDESRDHLLPFMGWVHKHVTPADSEIVARRCHARWVSREDLTMSFWERESGRLLGGTGLHRISWDVPSFEIGYWIRLSAQGHGFVTDTVKTLRDHAFGDLGAKRVFLRIASDNPRSAAVARRAGFVHEGRTRNEVMDVDGGLHDMDYFGMTPEEWRSLLP